VSELVRGLDRHGVVIRREEYATHGRDEAKLFGVLNLAIPELDSHYELNYSLDFG
jgi:hypothetical protein